jgi:hypothetical protein
MIVDPRRNDPSLGERAVQRLLPFIAGLVSQPDADQNQERNDGRSDQAEQLRSDAMDLEHAPPHSGTNACFPAYSFRVQAEFSSGPAAGDLP